MWPSICVFRAASGGAERYPCFRPFSGAGELQLGVGERDIVESRKWERGGVEGGPWVNGLARVKAGGTCWVWGRGGTGCSLGALGMCVQADRFFLWMASYTHPIVQGNLSDEKRSRGMCIYSQRGLLLCWLLDFSWKIIENEILCLE